MTNQQTLDAAIATLEVASDHQKIDINHDMVAALPIGEYTLCLAGQASQDALDAMRFRWLIEDHDDWETREKARELAERLGTSTYFAITRDIDTAIASSRAQRTNKENNNG